MNQRGGGVKVVLKQVTLYGSSDPAALQRVADAYVGGEEYRVSAPPGAKGDALDWVGHLSVRRPEGPNSESEPQGDIARLVLEAVAEELRGSKRDASRALGLNPDGLHWDAQICLTGHVQSCGGTPFDRKDHCTKCGAPCIDECPHCGEPIRGVGVYASPASYVRPQYCHGCGHPYPWMEDRLRTSREMLEHDDKLSPDDRDRLWGDLQYVMSDPKAELVPAKRKLIEIYLGRATPYVREFFLDLIAKVTAEVLKG